MSLILRSAAVNVQVVQLLLLLAAISRSGVRTSDAVPLSADILDASFSAVHSHPLQSPPLQSFPEQSPSLRSPPLNSLPVQSPPSNSLPVQSTSPDAASNAPSADATSEPRPKAASEPGAKPASEPGPRPASGEPGPPTSEHHTAWNNGTADLSTLAAGPKSKPPAPTLEPAWERFGVCSGGKGPFRVTITPRRIGTTWKGWGTSLVEEFAKNPALGNITFNSLEPFNEGLEGQWVSGMEQEGCNFNPPEMSRVLLKTWLALRRRKLKTKLVGIDSNAALTSVGLPLVIGKSLLHRINVHGYPLPLQMFFNLTTSQAKAATTVRYTHMKLLARALRKEVWVSESCPLLRQGNAYDLSLYLMRNVIESVNILEASAYIYWQIYDGGGDKWSVIGINWEHPLVTRAHSTLLSS
ncbi:hypothetical protein CLOP_g10901 [Closterium sp. NIES-67]|nr:hypothetical protein CLOP_g10901 [Closterium sp. NIES-67]